MKPLRVRLPSWLISALLLILIAYFWFRPPAAVENLDVKLAGFTATTLDGRPIASDELRGKVVLINVWATWCLYCRKEMPALDEFYRDWHGRGVELLALSTDDDPETAARFMREKGYAFPAAMWTPSAQMALGSVSKLPTSFVIDREGRLRHRVVGQLYYGRMEDLVRPLLAGGSGS